MSSENQIKIQRLYDDKMGKVRYSNDRIQSITNNSQRTVSADEPAKLNEFRYESGKIVPVGTEYHIHYTNDFKVYYMTGHLHNRRSRIIIPKKNKSDFKTYVNLSGNKSLLNLTSEAETFTEKDYNNYVVTRHFARKANEKDATPFPISQAQIGSSPLYIYSTFRWAIFGSRKKVIKFNKKQRKKASKLIPNIAKYLPLLEFHRGNDLSKRQEVLSRLGITQTTISSGAGSQSQGSGGSSGGGSGGSSGGSGGSSGGSSGGGSGGGGY